MQTDKRPGGRGEGELSPHPLSGKPSPGWVGALLLARDESIRQLFIVGGMGPDKTTAAISLHERDEDGSFRQVLSTPGFVGRNGLCRDDEHREGMGKTPMGVYTFNKAFGICEDPGCALPYVKVDEDIWWSGDEREGMHYNEMVDVRDCPGLDRARSEHIIAYEPEYRYCLNISFNEEGTPGRGSAIFLHCLGEAKPFTGGCVAIPESVMKEVLRRVRPGCVVVIDTFENLGGYFYTSYT